MSQSVITLIKSIQKISPKITANRIADNILWEGEFTPDEETLTITQQFYDSFSKRELKNTFKNGEPSYNEPFSFQVSLKKNVTNYTFYIDKNDFFQRIKEYDLHKMEQSLNENYYILAEKIDSNDEVDPTFLNELNNLKSLLLFTNNLIELAHHNTKNDELVFISHTEKKDISIDFSIKTDDIPPNLIKDKNYKDFLSPILEENHNSIKVKAIFRAALVELLEKNTDSNKFLYILDKYDDLVEIYNKNYEIFVNGISLKKIKAELAQEQMKLFESINKGLQNITSQAMIIPGLALFGIIIRTYNSSKHNTSEIIQNDVINSNMILFIVSLLVSALIILISIKNQQDLSRTLKSTQKISINNLDNISQQLKQEITHVLKQIDSVIDNSQKILKLYIKALFIVPSIFLGILFYSIIPASIYLVLFFIGYWYLVDRKIIKKIGIKTFKIWLTIKNRFKKIK